MKAKASSGLSKREITVFRDGARWFLRGAGMAGAPAYESQQAALEAAHADLRETGGEVRFEGADGRVRHNLTLGRSRIAQINAVEGVYLSPEVHEQLRRFDRDGLSSEQRRRILRAQFEGK